jgi:hypothetical protein
VLHCAIVPIAIVAASVVITTKNPNSILSMILIVVFFLGFKFGGLDIFLYLCAQKLFAISIANCGVLLKYDAKVVIFYYTTK